MSAEDRRFERIGGRMVYEGKIVTLAIDRFRFADGEEVEREIVRHQGAVAMVCHDETDLYLVRQPREAVGDPDFLEIPAGRLDREGESPLDAARRELAEETGLDPDAIVDRPVRVARDVAWNGKRYVGTEPFFLARFDVDAPALRADGLMEDERHNLAGHAWLSRTEIAALNDPLEPPELLAAVAQLDPAGGWTT